MVNGLKWMMNYVKILSVWKIERNFDLLYNWCFFLQSLLYCINILINIYVRVCGKNIEKVIVCVLVFIFYRICDVIGLIVIWVWYFEFDRYIREYFVDFSG